MSKRTPHEICLACVHNLVCKHKSEYHKLANDAYMLQDDGEDGYDRRNPESFNFIVTVVCKFNEEAIKNPR